MKTIIALIMMLGQLVMSWYAPANSIKPDADTSDFVPVVRFEVFSDSHVKTFADTNSKRMQKAISLAYADADADSNYNSLDAIMMVGDLTDNGRTTQFRAFGETLGSVVRDGTEIMGVVHSGHDCSTNGRKGLTLAETYVGIENDFHKVINGYHFIGVSVSEDDSVKYSAGQYEWMKQQLDEAVADDPTKPVFVIHHEHVSNTVYGSSDVDGWGQKFFKDLFSQYPQIVHFSGHSHYPINDPRSIWQGEFTAVGTGSLYYTEHTVDGKNVIHPENNDKMAQCWIVEVDAENTVRLRGFDALSGKMLVEYYLNDVADANERIYTPEQRKEASSAPEFTEDSKLTIKKQVGGKYKITAPAANSTDGNIIFLYRVFVLSDGEVKYTEYLVNDYQIADCYKTVSFTVKANSGDEIQVIAENAYSMQSAPLSTVIG